MALREREAVQAAGEPSAPKPEPELSLLRRRLHALHERYGEFAEDNGYVRCEDTEVWHNAVRVRMSPVGSLHTEHARLLLIGAIFFSPRLTGMRSRFSP